MDNFVYRYGNSLYINLTNKCTNACDFCIRNNGDGIGDSGNLWLDREPSASEVIDRIKSFENFDELVFCGYGEPTYKIDALLEVALFARQNGIKTRLNTNGHGSKINGYDITERLSGLIDTVSVSLNSHSPEGYDEICHCEYGLDGFSVMLDFTKSCVNRGIKTVMSVVDVSGVDVDKCRALASDMGVELRVRDYIE